MADRSDKSDRADRAGYCQRQRVDGELLAPAWGKMLINGRMAAVLYTTADGVGLAGYRLISPVFRKGNRWTARYYPLLSVIYRYLLLCPSAILPAYAAVLYSTADGVGLAGGRIVPPFFR